MCCTIGLTEQEHKPAHKNDSNKECNKHTFLSLIQSPPSVFSSSISFPVSSPPTHVQYAASCSRNLLAGMTAPPATASRIASSSSRISRSELSRRRRSSSADNSGHDLFTFCGATDNSSRRPAPPAQRAAFCASASFSAAHPEAA
ncbi:hypothetical protein ACVXHA_17870 [Escherichia coli]